MPSWMPLRNLEVADPAGQDDAGHWSRALIPQPLLTTVHGLDGLQGAHGWAGRWGPVRPFAALSQVWWRQGELKPRVGFEQEGAGVGCLCW